MTNTPAWAATITIDISLVETLLSTQFPALLPLTITSLGEGWDNVVFQVNDRYVFRFPRRTEGVQLMTDEIRVMPALKKHIAVPISYPCFIGEPTEVFPYPFAGYDFLEGHAVSDLDFSILPRTILLEQLALFLRELHHLDIKTLPVHINEDIGRMDDGPRAPVIIQGLTQLVEAGHPVDRQTLLSIMERTRSAFPAHNTCFVHGDLHPRHILMQDNQLSGIIDWGDASFGCKAIDLSIVFTLYPPQYHAAFWSLYGEVDIRIKEQALFRAIYSNVLLCLYALDVHNNTLLYSSLQGLKHCAEFDSI